MGFEWELQKAILATLKADAALSLLVTKIYDNVPQATDSGSGAAFPYVVVGDDSHQAWSTDTEQGSDSTLTIHSWSRYLGFKEIKQIQAAVYAALDRATLTVTGYAFVTCDYLNSDSFVDADGFTRHGVQTFRVLLDQA